MISRRVSHKRPEAEILDQYLPLDLITASVDSELELLEEGGPEAAYTCLPRHAMKPLWSCRVGGSPRTSPSASERPQLQKKIRSVQSSASRKAVYWESRPNEPHDLPNQHDSCESRDRGDSCSALARSCVSPISTEAAAISISGRVLRDVRVLPQGCRWEEPRGKRRLRRRWLNLPLSHVHRARCMVRH